MSIFARLVRRHGKPARRHHRVAGSTHRKESLMPRQMFVNLPVKDLDRSVAFFTRLGYAFNPKYTDENATCMIVGSDCFVMLLVEPFFQGFSPKPIGDAHRSAQAIVAVSMDDRAAVDAHADAALAAGATASSAPRDYGFMYQRGYQDLDGHLWEVFFMDEQHPDAPKA
jgi:predicted lactoylglutathione lyase